ncbi:sugar/nucleoside kinase (ribokinase family) [Xanthomonas sp. JAI131]|nr:sugar/nucleoside kinase (ribokinase family) [Xanthomonas sp. JAI131]
MALDSAMSACDVAVVGEIYADHILSGFQRWPQLGEEALASAYLRELGGGTVNTACGLARLGRSTRLIGLIGESDRPWFAQRLGQFQVRSDGLRSDPAGTGITVSVSMPDDRAFFTYLGANAQLDALLARAEVLDELCAARHVHFAMPLSRALAQTLLPALAAAGCTTSLDVGFSPDWLAAPHNLATCREVDYFLPNQKEAALLGCGDGAEACRQWAQTLGLRHAAIKLGGAGAMAVDAAGARRVAAPAVQVRDTTGAGDAFDAGFIDALLDGAGLDDCLRRACFCGASCCAALGALDGLPDFDQLRNFNDSNES